LLISPITIHKLMSMLYVGSPEGSETFKQLSKALYLTSGPAYKEITDEYDAISKNKNTGSTLKLAGTMIIKDMFTVKEQFKRLIKNSFSATTKIFKTPDEGVRLVNDWAKEKTNGMIGEILKDGDVSDDARLILASACYFKSDWKTMFKKSDTKPMEFTLASKKKVQIEKGMNMFNMELNYADTVDFEVVELPYKHEEFSMYIALPKRKGMEALNKVTAGFCTDKFQDQLKIKDISRLRMPSFDATSGIDLKKPLEALGIKDAFDENRADFSKIAKEHLHVEKVKTKTVVKVNEEGSEAAAVAVAMMDIMKSAHRGPPPFRFIVNRPFVFMIYDKKHKVPLFKGRIVNPQEN